MKPTEFQLVLYKSQPAIVTAIESDKIDITTPSGTKRVREKDISLLHRGPVKDLKKVLDASLGEGNLAEARDFFEGEKPTFAEVAELVWGALPAESAWACWKAVSQSPWFVAGQPDEPLGLRPKAEAEELIRKAGAKQAEGAERDAFLARLAAVLGGTGEPLPDADSKYLQDVEALALGTTEKSRTLRDAGIAETPQNAHRVLLKTGFWTDERNPWPSRYGHSLRSSTVPVDEPADTKERLDLTALDAWAIDNDWSADPDDAVSFDGEALWVHVADPASTVLPDCPADVDARARGSTLYIPEGAARMLAENSLDYYALGLSDESRALSFRITFTETGAIAGSSVHRTRVRVSRLTYAEASARKDSPELAPLFAIAERNIARRKAAGAVFIDLPEVHLSVRGAGGGKGEVVIEPVQAESAADMVREMMLLAGEAAARFAFKNGIPFQYVSQERADLPAELPPGIAGEYRKRRAMKSRKVGTIPADHAGLGLGMYSQVTSPLRRYGDLVAHQQLHLFLDGKRLLDTDDMLTRIASGDAAARACTQAERNSNLHWILNYLLARPDWTARAVVVEQNAGTATILVPSLAQEARIKSDAAPGTELTVRAGNIDIAELSVSFIPV